MSSNLKAYQQQLFAKNHYRKLVSAKTTLTQFHGPKHPIVSPNRTITPLDQYEYDQTNTKLRDKLKEIYKKSAKKIKQQRRQPKQHTKSLLLKSSSSKDKSIYHQNLKIFERIVRAKSTIGEDLRHREQSLKKYSKITRKKPTLPDDTLFTAYREILIESRGAAGRRSLRPASARSSCKSKKRPASARKSAYEARDISSFF